MRLRFLAFSVLGVLGLCLLCALVYNLPPVHERLSWRVASLRSQIYYAINPPQEAVFVPQEQQALIEAIVQATLDALISSPTVIPIPSTVDPTLIPLTPSALPTASPSPTLAPTPIPGQVLLNGITHEYQQMNNCGPATLAMMLTYWGWQGDQRDTRRYLRPNFADVDDKNVNPSEMVSYIESQTELEALVRVGGNIETLKRLLAAGFPVIVEKGFQPPKEDWMGHYEVLNGYDDGLGRFITQDSYIMPDFPVPYGDISERWWRDFNGIYLVAYPPEREAELLTILGPDADPAENYRRAADNAVIEAEQLSGRDLFFTWFNLGSSLVGLENYPEAAQAFDQAFAVYASLPERERPWRALWYRHEPYAAYYHTGRYQDAINLANTALSFLSAPILEETLYWRGLAKEARGDVQGATAKYPRAVRVTPPSTGAMLELQRLGMAAP
jgi:tetratricopeptide (TPR) repeat protein